MGQSNGNSLAGGIGSFHNPSRFGFKGSEDLGGGLTANFNLETGGLDMATGNAANVNNATGDFSFNREAWVGLAGAFGSTRIGRTSSVAAQANAAFDFNHISASSAMASVGISPVTWYSSSRRSAQFQYSTPTVSGFSAGLGYVAAGDNGAVGSEKATTQARVNYANGPLAVGFTTETARAAANRTASAVFASYDLGMAKIGAGSVTSEKVAAAANAIGSMNGGKGSYFNVDVPFGAFNVGVQYAKNTQSKDDATELYARYTLSKRTFVYLDTVSIKGTTIGDVKKTGLGIMHSF